MLAKKRAHSRTQEVTVSGISEAEYADFSKAVKEVLLTRQMQGFMEPSIMISTVNVFESIGGAVKLAVNRYASRISTLV